MKNILILNKYYSPVIGGIETVVELYATHLSKNHNVKVLVCNKSRNDKPKSIFLNDRLNIIYTKTLVTVQKLPISFTFFYNFLLLSKWADVVYIHEPFPLGTFASIFLKKNNKIIVTWHSDILNQRILSYIVKPLQDYLLAKADIITTTSLNLLTNSSQLQKKKNKVQIIPLSIDTHKSIKTINSKEFIGDDLKAIMDNVDHFCLYFGRLSYYKGINTLANVYKKNHSELIPIIIVGEGELESLVSTLQNEIPSKLFFLNRFLTEDEKIFLISNCQFFVFPSNKITEAFGITQLEAMIQSKPVINTNLPTGVPWVSINGITGITVEVDNELELFNAIQRLSSDLNYRCFLGENAKKRVFENFSHDINLSLLEKMIKRI